ncbi:hypothetical protein A0H81_12731 [Grifola frondosa]|uniref:Uncharacterized protein n=1 Tax=Grifola frondosa TaxID=5627 RepID=A0A1C7LRR2_GRIFR|nr:hypothetical protein A0H81_12731 [Grifola frondosa]
MTWPSFVHTELAVARSFTLARPLEVSSQENVPVSLIYAMSRCAPVFQSQQMRRSEHPHKISHKIICRTLAHGSASEQESCLLYGCGFIGAPDVLENLYCYHAERRSPHASTVIVHTIR